MDYWEGLFSEQLVEAIGWSIFHSIWQVPLLLIILIIALFFTREFSARVRYFVSYTVLLIILGWSVTTGVKSYHYAREKMVVKERLLTNPDGMVKEIKSLFGAEKEIMVKKASNAKLKWIKFKTLVQNSFHVIFVLWLLGILFFLLRMAGGMAYLLRLTKRQTIPFEDKWLLKLENLAIYFSISKPVKALQSYVVKVPMIIGQLKPVILIPACLFTGLSEKEIEAIIAHELAHIKRNDYFFNIIQTIIETLFFFNPAVWVVSRIIRDEREHSCDEIAVEATGDKISYIKALASAQELTLKTPYKTVAFAQSSGGLLTRVKRLKTMSNMKNKVNEGFFATALIFVSLVLLSFTMTDDKAKNEMLNSLKVYEIPDSENPVNDDPVLPEFYRDTIEKKVRKRIEKMEEVPEDLEKVIEVALTENDEVMAAEILQSVEEAMKEIEWAEIQEEAMREVELEMADLNLDSIISESMREAELEIAKEMEVLKEMEHEIMEEAIISQEEALKIAKEAMEVARVSFEAIDMDSIIEFSINHSMKVIEDLNIGEIIHDAMEGVEITFDNDSKTTSKSLENMEKELDELEKMK